MSIQHLQGLSVLGNANKDFVTPAGTQRRILYGLLKLNTGVAVANRWVRLAVLDEAGTTIICLCAGASVPASATDQWFSYLQGVYRETSFINGVLQVPIAQDLIIPPGHTLRAFVQNGQAADSFDCDFMAEDSHVGDKVG